MLELIGWIGSICFAICAAPQALKSYRDGNSDGISWGFLGLWLVGEVFCLIYVIPQGQAPLIFNYILNLVFLLVILRYKIRRRT